MNPWYFIIGTSLILLCLIIGLIICLICLIIKTVKKRNKKSAVISMTLNFLGLAVMILYVSSHGTYYKYNDWLILNKNINEIEQKYGKFDLGGIKENQKGRVAYYTYTDNGPIMPDHLKHYYYIEYDEQGIIYNVYDGSLPGG